MICKFIIKILVYKILAITLSITKAVVLGNSLAKLDQALSPMLRDQLVSLTVERAAPLRLEELELQPGPEVNSSRPRMPSKQD